MDATTTPSGPVVQAWQLLGGHPVLVGLLLLVPVLLYPRYSRGLQRYPGPLLASFSNFWAMWVSWRGQAEADYIALHRQYGPVARIGPNKISFASPAAAKTIFRAGAGFHKTPFYSNFLPDPDIFTEIREDVHAVKKRYANPPYSLASVQYHNEGIEALMRKLLDRLDVFAAEGDGRCDLGAWVHYFAFDTLGQFAFARPFDCLDDESTTRPTIDFIKMTLRQSSILGHVPRLAVVVGELLKVLPVPQAIMKLQDMAIGLIKQYQEQKEQEGVDKCLLNSLVESMEKSDGALTMTDVVTISMGAIGAGSDTTSSTMQSFLYHVLVNRQVYDRLVSEILSSPLSEMVQYQEALSLPYFQACMKEGMRLQPALAEIMSRRVPPGGADIDGTFLPGGTEVAVNSWVVHRDKGLFGEDADDFNPDRWLRNSEVKVKDMERSMYQFGGGSHLCIGRQLALFEMNKLLPQLLRRYDMRLVHPDRPLPHETGLFYIQEGLEVYLKRH